MTPGRPAGCGCEGEDRLRLPGKAAADKRGDARAGTLAGAAAGLLEVAGRHQASVAVAESLTGGMVASALVGLPGASSVLVGAVVAYATRVKNQVLGVDADRLMAFGPVDAVVAEQMAEGVSHLMGADVGLATTGVAGPGPADGKEPGTVYIAVSTRWGTVHQGLHCTGGRARVRYEAAAEVLRLATRLLSACPPGAPGR